MASLPVSETAIYWMDQPAVVEFVGGVCRCTITSGGVAFEFRCSKGTMLKATLAAAQAYASECRRKSNVVPLKGAPIFIEQFRE
jgi:hypothetical protein